MHDEIKTNSWVTPKDPELLFKVLTTQYGLSYPEAGEIAKGKVLLVAETAEHTLRLDGWSMQLPRQMFKKYQEPGNVAQSTKQTIDLTSFYRTAAAVKAHSKESVVLHMAAEVGEVSECLVQPHRNGDIVEESIDVILCALDVIYLELGKTHGNNEITAIINKKMDAKSEKWFNTCKK